MHALHLPHRHVHWRVLPAIVAAAAAAVVSQLATDGGWVLWLPVAASLVPAILPVRTEGPIVGAAALLWLFAVIAGFSVGLLYVPAAILMTVAASRPSRTSPAR